MKTTYNKLIRDKIPEIIAADGTSTCEIRQLSDEEFLLSLNAKLQEEVTEYLESENIEELADIEEVIRAILVAKGSSYGELEKIRLEKKEKHGGFEKRLFLVSTTNTKYDSPTPIKTLADFTALLEREKTVTPYKYSLLKAVIETCQQYPQYVESSTDGTRKILPLGICVMKWMMYYYPFFCDGKVIAMTNKKSNDVAFRLEFRKVCEHYNGMGGLSVFRDEIVSGQIPEDILPCFQELFTKIRGAILGGPICHFGGSDTGEKYTIFRKEKRASSKMKTSRSLKDLIEHCGTYSIPVELWSMFTMHGGYIIGNGTVMDKWLEFLVKYNEEMTRNDLHERLLTLPVDERVVEDARNVYVTMVKKNLVCVWNNKTKLTVNNGDSKDSNLEVDHLLPFSIWKSNALWNLLPACKKMNRDKLDSIPSRHLLEMRKERIFACWDVLYGAYPVKFENEIATDLLKGKFIPKWKEAAFQQLCDISDYLIHTRGCQEWAGPKQP